MTTTFLALVAASACKRDSHDTAVQPSHRYTHATLDPVMEHQTSIWAGGAILDFDADGLADLFFTNGFNMPDRLYRNTGDGVFVDVGAEAGVDSLLDNGSVVAGDLDNDGDADLIVSGSCTTGSYAEQDGHKIVYHNQGDGTFAERKSAFVDNAENLLNNCTSSMTLVDIDLDGFLDLLVADGVDPDVVAPWVFSKAGEGGENTIFFNDGTGRFREWQQFGSQQVTFAAAAWDYTGDGRPDPLWGQGGRELEGWDLSGDYKVPVPRWNAAGRGLWMGMAVADFDNNGHFDVYATNMGLSAFVNGYDATGDTSDVPGAWVNPYHSLILNDGDRVQLADWDVVGGEMRVGDLFDGYYGQYDHMMYPTGLARHGWGWGVVALDANADGWMDVAYTGNNCSAPMCIIWEETRGAGPGGLLLNNQGQGFVDATWDYGAANLDPEGRYPDGRGMLTGDLNNDGFADIVHVNRSYTTSETDPLSQHGGSPIILLSDASMFDRHWLQVDPVGTQSNRDGIGSVVTITGAHGSFQYIVGAGGGTCSMSETLLTVGTGEATEVDVTVRFPSGIEVEIPSVATDQRIVVEET